MTGAALPCYAFANKEAAMETKPFVQLSGEDGNVFFIMARCHVAAKKAGWSAEQWEAVKKEMESGDYDHALQVVMQNFRTR